MNRNLLKFILFVPVSVIVYGLTRMSLSFAFTLIDAEMVATVHKQVGFHNYLLGPIFVLLENGLSVLSSVYAGVSIVPKFKKGIYYGYLTLWIVMLVFVAFTTGLVYHTISWTTEMVLLICLLVSSQGLGFILARRYLWREIDAVEVDKYFDSNLIDNT